MRWQQKNSNKFQDWQLQIITTLHQSYTKLEPILVVDEDSRIVPITSYSMMISALSDQNENVTFLMIDERIANDPQIKQFINTIHSNTAIGLTKTKNTPEPKPILTDKVIEVAP